MAMLQWQFPAAKSRSTGSAPCVADLIALLACFLLALQNVIHRVRVLEFELLPIGSRQLSMLKPSSQALKSREAAPVCWFWLTSLSRSPSAPLRCQLLTLSFA